MKSTGRFPFKLRQAWGVPALMVLLAVSNRGAADTNAPPVSAPAPLTPQQFFEGGSNSYNNWIEFSAGGFLTGGNKAQFEQINQSRFGAFGGIEDFHYQKDLDKTTALSADGHAIVDNQDYKLNLALTRENLGFVRFSFNQFREWYNGDGGYFPPKQSWFPLSGDALGLDRGEFSIEAGLTLEKYPKITFKYTHRYRDGDKSSTEWGYTHPAGGLTVRGLSPSFYNINESSDIFQLDLTHHIKQTDIGVGVSYETGKIADALRINQFPGESVNEKITDQQNTGYDLFSVHAFTETWVRKNLLLSSGFAYSDSHDNLSGSRIYGSDFDVGYVPNFQYGQGYYGLSGGAGMQDYVADLNLMYRPVDQISIVPSVRVEKQDSDANDAGTETLGAFTPVPFVANGGQDEVDVTERLDLNYSGITNWAFFARGEWMEGNGSLNGHNGLLPVNGIGVQPVQYDTDDHQLFQKYSLGTRWYPARGVTVDVGGYYKFNDYDYTHPLDSTANTNNSPTRYPAYLAMQNFETYDANARLTLRPWKNITLASRYEYQYSTIHTEPDPTSGLGDAESSSMVSHIISQNASWAPWSRLYLQAGVNFVFSETKTPASDLTQAVLAAQNNYWTLTFSSGLVLDDKTDLNVTYFYYHSDNYDNISLAGVPYGAGAEEQSVTVALVRRLTKNLRVSLKYGYSRYRDDLSGGNNNFDSHLVYSTLQYRF